MPGFSLWEVEAIWSILPSAFCAEDAALTDGRKEGMASTEQMTMKTRHQWNRRARVLMVCLDTSLRWSFSLHTLV